MITHQYVPAQFSTYRQRRFTRFHLEQLFFQFRIQHSAWYITEPASVHGGWAFRVFQCLIGKPVRVFFDTAGDLTDASLGGLLVVAFKLVIHCQQDMPYTASFRALEFLRVEVIEHTGIGLIHPNRLAGHQLQHALDPQAAFQLLRQLNLIHPQPNQRLLEVLFGFIPLAYLIHGQLELTVGNADLQGFRCCQHPHFQRFFVFGNTLDFFTLIGVQSRGCRTKAFRCDAQKTVFLSGR